MCLPKGGAENSKKFHELAKRILNEEFYPKTHPDGKTGGINEENFSSIVHDAAYARITGMLSRTKGTVEFGGTEGKSTDKDKRWHPLTIVSGVEQDDSLMEECVRECYQSS